MEHVSNLSIPPATTWSELTSEPFLRAFADEVGVTLEDLVVGAEGDRAVARMGWSFDPDLPGVPELAKRFLPARVHLDWEQSWAPLGAAERADGRLDVVLQGRPGASAIGDCRLEATPDGSTLRTTTRTSTELPFPLAGRIEALIDKELIGWIIAVQARVLLRRNPG
ncbi:MAG: DUF2505 domain-containing protein [Candidatus Nanopelagicales bacterium]|nr:DUF2505 domain-containing protein [Candidatus Nanopelagicales bacterium]